MSPKRKSENRVLRDSVFALTRRLEFLTRKFSEVDNGKGLGGYFEAETGAIIYALKLMERRLKELKAKEGNTMIWVLILTMPSGSRWVLAPNPKNNGEGSIALFPISEEVDTRVNGAFGFKTEEDAKAWMQETAKLSQQGAKLMESVQPILVTSMQ